MLRPLLRTRIGTLACFSLCVAVLMIAPASCGRTETESGRPTPPPAVSLLLQIPFVGDETEIRQSPPTPARMLLNETSVEGWLMSPQGMLRFPVEIRETARLSFRLGAKSRLAIETGELLMRVEYVPRSGPGIPANAQPEPVVLFETTNARTPECMVDWYNVDVPLESWAPGTGEIRFSTDAGEGGGFGIDVLWGQPVVYHPAERHHRNVLLIGIDTLRRDALDIYGGRPEISPNIHRLSESATIFDRAWSQAPHTGPSFASMLTGRLPSDIGPTISNVQLPPGALTIAEMLLPLGYTTSMICGNTYLGADISGFNQGIEQYFYRLHATPDVTVEKATEFIRRSGDRDWFLFLHFMDPHNPYDPPQELIDSLCDPGYTGEFLTSFDDMRDWRYSVSQPPQNEVRRVKSLYDAEVADVDAGIGRLFEYLESSGLIEETLIILAADHGEEFFEHGEYGHGQSLYEEMVHLGLMAWGPDLPKGVRIDSCVANLDIVPTILRFLGQPPPEGLAGIPLQDTASGTISDGRIILGEGNLRRNHHRKFAVEWPYKCILDYFTGETTLFDLESDPDERNDISTLHPEIARRLSEVTARAMVPMQTTFIVAVTGDREGGPAGFSGTIRVPGGIDFVMPSGLISDDGYYIEGDTITFDLTSETTLENPMKALVVIPEEGGDTIEVSVLADGRVDPNRLYPYGTDTPEPTGAATARVFDLPWPNRIPMDSRELPVACYVLGFPGHPRDTLSGFQHIELDPETREQLRALGYVQ